MTDETSAERDSANGPEETAPGEAAPGTGEPSATDGPAGEAEAAGPSGDEAPPTGGDAAADDGGDAAEERSPEDEIADLKDKLLRALADRENMRRRADKERLDARRYGAVNLAREMLAVADNLRRALESAPDRESGNDEALAGFVEGVVLTEKGLLSVLEGAGVRRIEPEGERFDPHLHEAMLEAPSPDAEPGTVVQVLEVGYVMHDRLLRPAKVAVAKAVPETRE